MKKLDLMRNLLKPGVRMQYLREAWLNLQRHSDE